MRTRPNISIFVGRPDFIPIVDVFFLLLIFFLISSSLVFQPGIPVELPKVHDSSMSAAEKVVVTITASGQIFLNDSPVKDEDLPRKLRETIRSRVTIVSRRLNENEAELALERSPKIIIRGDQRVPYQKIANIIGLARSLGLGAYLATDSQQLGIPRTRPTNDEAKKTDSKQP
jgi:biopolymer transport protein ExbD